MRVLESLQGEMVGVDGVDRTVRWRDMRTGEFFVLGILLRLLLLLLLMLVMMLRLLLLMMLGSLLLMRRWLLSLLTVTLRVCRVVVVFLVIEQLVYVVRDLRFDREIRVVSLDTGADVINNELIRKSVNGATSKE
jgi:hypothetical protein